MRRTSLNPLMELLSRFSILWCPLKTIYSPALMFLSRPRGENEKMESKMLALLTFFSKRKQATSFIGNPLSE